MGLKLVTAVTTEPVSLSEAKEYLRLDSTTFEDNLTIVNSIAGGYHVSATLTGTSTSILGYKSIVLVEPFSNSASGTVDISIYESDDNITFTAWTAGSTSFTQITTANDTVNQQIEYTGNKEYITGHAVITTADCNFSISIIKGAPESIEDTFISGLITTAREYCENYQHRSFATQTWKLVLNDFPSCDRIEIPKAPLQSVSSVKYIDYLGATSTMTAGLSGYLVDTDSEPGNVYLAYGIEWPSFTPQPYSAVTIEFVCGYYASYTVPVSTKQAIMMLINHMYENRLPVIREMGQELEFTLTALLNQNILLR